MLSVWAARPTQTVSVLLLVPATSLIFRRPGGATVRLTLVAAAVASLVLTFVFTVPILHRSDHCKWLTLTGSAPDRAGRRLAEHQPAETTCSATVSRPSRASTKPGCSKTTGCKPSTTSTSTTLAEVGTRWARAFAGRAPSRALTVIPRGGCRGVHGDLRERHLRPSHLAEHCRAVVLVVGLSSRERAVTRRLLVVVFWRCLLGCCGAGRHIRYVHRCLLITRSLITL